MIICENNTVFAKSDFWSKTRQPAPVSPKCRLSGPGAFPFKRSVMGNASSDDEMDYDV